MVGQIQGGALRGAGDFGCVYDNDTCRYCTIFRTHILILLQPFAAAATTVFKRTLTAVGCGLFLC